MNTLRVKKILRKHGLKVEFVTWGVAFRYGDTVVMNRDLLYDNKFCMDVLNHEIKHSGRMTTDDFLMDIFDGDLVDNLKFMFSHPKALLRLVPIFKYKGVWSIDINLLIIYFVLLIILWAIL